MRTEYKTNDKKWYDDTVREMRSIRFTDPETVILKAREMLRRATAEENIGMIGLAELWIGDSYYTLMDRENCITYIHKAMRELDEAEDFTHLGECYNLLGMLFAHQGDNSSAFQSYSNGLDILYNHPDLNKLGVMLFENYGELCDRTGNSEEARKQDLTSLMYCERMENGTAEVASMRALILRELVLLDIRLGFGDEAREYMQELVQITKEYPNEEDSFDQYIVALLFAAFDGNKEREAVCERQAIESFRKVEYPIDYFWMAIHFLDYLQKRDKFREMEEIISLMEYGMNEETFPDLMVRLTRYRIQMMEKQGDKRQLLEQYRLYYQYIEARDVVQNHTLSLLMSMQKSLHLSAEKNIFLQHRADTDALTGISNRGRYNEVADHLLNECLQNRKDFAIEMLDIDHFKQINDQYGHRTGDEVLKVMGDVLRETASGNICVFRYGGDEFAVIYTGMTPELIQKSAEDLQASFRKNLQAAGLPEATVSQGICHGIPRSVNRIWDFASLADQEMYQGKRAGGGRIRMITKETKVGNSETLCGDSAGGK